MSIRSVRKTGMLLFLALLPVAGCERTSLYYDDDPDGGVEIKVDWSGLPQGASLPEGVLITFYDPEKGTDYTFFRETAGGKISMPDGEYESWYTTAIRRSSCSAIWSDSKQRRPIWKPVPGEM